MNFVLDVFKSSLKSLRKLHSSLGSCGLDNWIGFDGIWYTRSQIR